MWECGNVGMWKGRVLIPHRIHFDAQAKRTPKLRYMNAIDAFILVSYKLLPALVVQFPLNHQQK